MEMTGPAKDIWRFQLWSQLKLCKRECSQGIRQCQKEKIKKRRKKEERKKIKTSTRESVGKNMCNMVDQDPMDVSV